MPPLLLKLVFDRMESGPAPFFLKPLLRAISGKAKSAFIQPQLTLHLDYIESELAKSTWFAGNELTAADIQMSYPLEAARSRAGLASDRPRSVAFLQRIHARPAYQRALERGGEYALSKD